MNTFNIVTTLRFYYCENKFGVTTTIEPRLNGNDKTSYIVNRDTLIKISMVHGHTVHT